MNQYRMGHTATLLNNGMVLITGGIYGGQSYTNRSAELYDPLSGTFSYTTGSMTTPRAFHTATLLNNGKVLIAGGDDEYGAGVLSSAELYDPVTGTFSATTGTMASRRYSHTAALLNDGRVLIAGGENGPPFVPMASAELYDPVTDTFTDAASMSTPRASHTATLLNNGTVLIAGGVDASGNVLAGAELYQPTTLTPPGLVSIAVTPSEPGIAVGTSQQFTAIGTFSDGSTQILQSVTWNSSNQAVARVSNDATNHGTAYALAPGSTTITATAGSISGSTVLTVSQ
jgi:hypothetical protein